MTCVPGCEGLFSLLACIFSMTDSSLSELPMNCMSTGIEKHSVGTAPPALKAIVPLPPLSAHQHQSAVPPPSHVLCTLCEIFNAFLNYHLLGMENSEIFFVDLLKNVNESIENTIYPINAVFN